MSRYCVYYDMGGGGFSWLQELRLKFDPLAEKIPAHVTLVFPFSSGRPESEFIDHISSTRDSIADFSFSLAEPENHKGYCWFPVSDGAEDFIFFHQKLYSGFLKKYLDTSRTYRPHVTVGRWETDREGEVQLQLCRQLFEAHSGQVYSFMLGSTVLEKIDEHGYGEILFRF